MSPEGGFQIETPTNWTYFPRRGMDSFYGAIAANEKDTIFFNMGQYSPSLDHPFYKNLKDEEENEDSCKTKESTKTIKGYHAKFVAHWTKSSSDYGVYFDSLWTIGKPNDLQNKMKLTIYGNDLSERTQKELDQAVRTIRFFKP